MVQIPDKELDAVPHQKARRKSSRQLSGHTHPHDNTTTVKGYGTAISGNPASTIDDANTGTTSPSSPLRLTAEPRDISPVSEVDEDEEQEQGSGADGYDSEESESHAPRPTSPRAFEHSPARQEALDVYQFGWRDGPGR